MSPQEISGMARDLLPGADNAAAVVGLGGGPEPLPLVADGEDGTAHQLET
jgi:hypothetical protein